MSHIILFMPFVKLIFSIFNFRKTLRGQLFFFSTSDCVEILANYAYNISIINDKYTPQQTNMVATRRHAPWHNNTSREAKKVVAKENIRNQ